MSETCAICGGEAVRKKVEKLLHADGDVAMVTVEADVCTRCGERFFSPETIELFDEIREKLGKHETSGFKPVGQSFVVTH